MSCSDRCLDKAGEKRAAPAKAKRKPLARKETACSVPEEMRPESSPVHLDDAMEIPHRPDTAPAEIGSHPGDRYPTPQPEAAHHAKPSRRWRRRNRQQGDRETLKLQQPSGSPPDNVDQTKEPDDTKAATPEFSGGSPDPLKGEIIDLTVKEESPPAVPISPPAQVSGSNQDAPDLKAGRVRFREFLSSTLSDEKLGLVPTFGRHIMFHGCEEIVFDRRRGD